MRAYTARHKHLAIAALAVAMIPLSGCDKIQEMTGSAPTITEADLDPVLRDPKVGDRYAADLAHFSGYVFRDNEGEPMEHSYGLMRVMEVTPQRVVVITETRGGPGQQAARNRLNWDEGQVPWDESERIPITRSQFPTLVQDEMILDVRRGEPGATAALPKSTSAPAPNLPGDAADAAANAAEDAANAAERAAQAARDAAARAR